MNSTQSRTTKFGLLLLGLASFGLANVTINN
jgi:hypothetical protein